MEKLLKNHQLILFTILLLAFMVRFIYLGKIPGSMNPDEPALGYNAYSLLKTGRDEWGLKFPLAFKSFGDYKSPLYIYLTTIPIVVFGLNEFSVRFLSALAGFMIVMTTYFIVKQLFMPDQEHRESKNIAIITALLMAISSWAIFYSRFAFEANLSFLLNLLILYLLLKNNFRKISFLLYFLTALTLLTYSSALIILPLFYFLLAVYQIISLKKTSFRQKIITVAKLIILLLLTAVIFFSQNTIKDQKNKVTIFGNPQIRLDYNVKRQALAQQNLWQARLFYNQYFYYGKIFLSNYFKSFSPDFLFGGGGGHPWHKITQTAHLYLVYLPLIILGVVFLIKTKKIKTINKIFLGIFLAISMVPSAITNDAPHATRLLNYFFVLVILAGLGLYYLIKHYRYLGYLASGIILGYFIIFSKYYFIDYNKNLPGGLLPGIKETIAELKIMEPEAERIIFSSYNDASYIYLLFYTAYDPNQLFLRAKRYPPDTVGFEWMERLDKYVFVDQINPNPDYKEIYVLKSGLALNEKEITQIKDKNTNETYYEIKANF